MNLISGNTGGYFDAVPNYGEQRGSNYGWVDLLGTIDTEGKADHHYRCYFLGDGYLNTSDFVNSSGALVGYRTVGSKVL